MKVRLLNNLKHCGIFIVNLLILAFSFTDVVISQEVQLTAEEQQWLSEHPVIRSTNALDWAPIDFAENGKAKGLSIDYLNLIAEKVGFKIEYINGQNWAEHLVMLQAREIDITHSARNTASRREFLTFSKPYLNLPTVYYGRKGSEPIKSIDDLTDKRVSIVENFASAEIYKNDYPHFLLHEYKSVKEGLDALSVGENDVFPAQLPIANYIISKEFITGLEVIGGKFFPENTGEDNVHIAVRKDWPIFMNIINKGAAAITDR